MMCNFEPITLKNSLGNHEKKDAYEFSIVKMRRYKGEIGGTYLDLGANHGWTVINAIQIGFERVVAVEPSPDSCTIATRNFNDCERIQLLQKAVMAESGTVFIETHRNSLNQRIVNKAVRGDEVEVESVSFRSLIAEFRPSFVKFDIEGAEYEIIRDWHPETHVKGIALEVHKADKPENFFIIKQFMMRCKDQGFQVYSPGSYRMKDGLPRSWCHNFILGRKQYPDLSFYDQLEKENS